MLQLKVNNNFDTLYKMYTSSDCHTMYTLVQSFISSHLSGEQNGLQVCAGEPVGAGCHNAQIHIS